MRLTRIRLNYKPFLCVNYAHKNDAQFIIYLDYDFETKDVSSKIHHHACQNKLQQNFNTREKFTFGVIRVRPFFLKLRRI